CKRFWSCVSPPCTANDKKGFPSLRAKAGVSVTRGLLPGAITLNGLIRESSTKLCRRWLMPMPVFPAIHAGTHPPLGVMDTTHPSASAASTLVVPRSRRSTYTLSTGSVLPAPDALPTAAVGGVASCLGRKSPFSSFPGCTNCFLLSNRETYGFCFPSNG